MWGSNHETYLETHLCASTNDCFHVAAPADGPKPVVHVLQTAPTGALVKQVEADAVVLHFKHQPPGSELDMHDNIRRAGMLGGVVKRFLEGEKQIMTDRRRQWHRGQVGGDVQFA